MPALACALLVCTAAAMAAVDQPAPAAQGADAPRLDRFEFGVKSESRTASLTDAPRLERFEFERVEMAVPIKIVLYAADEQSAHAAATAAFDRIAQLNSIMSDYDETSQLRRLCESAGSPQAVKVSAELWEVLSLARQLAELSDGAFDPTVGPVVRLWRRARRQRELPSPTRLAAARELVGWRMLVLDAENHTVKLEKAGMRLDLGGIAKGYAVAEALRVLRQHGFARAMVNAGGDIGLGDPPPNRPGWQIGVAPQPPDNAPRFMLWLSNTAVATSGDMFQHVVIGGKRYSHIVDPRTGVGLVDQAAVTVIHPDPTMADGLSTAVSVLGVEKGLELNESIPHAAGVIVQPQDGATKLHQSKRFAKLLEASGRKHAENSPEDDGRSVD
jgi:thiamine biosynthesis lipoprotein